MQKAINYAMTSFFTTGGIRGQKKGMDKFYPRSFNMGVRHRSLPLEGVQFHPESVMTQSGHLMFANWLAACGDASARERAVSLKPVVAERFTL